MISIIIPTLNEEKHIHRLLDSLKNQDFKNFEIVIVDASNNNKTINVIKKYKTDLTINIIKSKKNVSFQRNLGVKKAKTQYIIFIDADSVPDNKTIGKTYFEMKNKNIESGGGHTYPLSSKVLYNIYYLLFRIFTRIFYKMDGINGCYIFTKKSIHEKIKGFNEEIILAEDYEYTKRLVKSSNFKLLTDVKVKTSIRRFNHDGKLMLPLKLISAGLYRLIIGDIKNDLFKYRFGIFNK